MKIFDLASPRFHKKERHGNERKERKKWTKEKSKIKDSKKSKENGLKKSKRKQRKKIESKDCHDLYGEERKIKNNKGVFFPQKPQNTTHLDLLIKLYDLFILRSGF
jgi:hypothetical protein